MSENILLSNTIVSEVQTERPHVTVTRYFEAAIQTDDQVDRLCIELCSEAKSMTSTQAGGEDQSAHTQPISLDMSPIKRMDRTDAALDPILEHAEVRISPQFINRIYDTTTSETQLSIFGPNRKKAKTQWSSALRN